MTKQIAALLSALDEPGTFAAQRRSSAGDLEIRVAGAGTLRLPVTPSAARKLIGRAAPARYGLRTKTIHDEQVRKTWEIAKERVRLPGGDEWAALLRKQLDLLAIDLGLPGRTLRAELHNMLVYEPGQFFITHQDSEKSDTMIATLVVILPSSYEGGELVVHHHREKRSFEGHRSKLTFVAFYADCRHEVRPVIDGYRVALTFNLLLDDSPEVPTDPAEATLAALERAIARHFETPTPGFREPGPPPDRLIYLLDHEYTERNLSWKRLKNQDQTRATALLEVARRLDCEIYLCQADVHEVWDCEWGKEYPRRGWRPSGTPTPTALCDSDVGLRGSIAPSGQRTEAESAVKSAELFWTRPSADLEPFKSEYEPYMGNWGNTLDRWYHRAAIVLWPRARTFRINAKASAPWAVREIARVLSAGDLESARRMAAQLEPFWARTASADSSARLPARTLKLAIRLSAPKLAAFLLEPFGLTPWAGEHAQHFSALLERYGLEWTSELFERWNRSARGWNGEITQQRRNWIAELPAFCGPLILVGGPPALQLSARIVAAQWAWFQAELGAALGRPTVAERRRALAELDRAVLGLLESCLIIEDPGLQEEMLGVLLSRRDGAGACSLVQLVRSAGELYPPEALAPLGMDRIRAHARSVLEACLATPARAKDDWSIAAPSTCGCGLCAELASFLTAPEVVQLEWPLAKDKRAHVHGRIDAHDLPVAHETRRIGSPHIFVLTKTKALFEREAAERKAWADALDWLDASAPVEPRQSPLSRWADQAPPSRSPS